MQSLDSPNPSRISPHAEHPNSKAVKTKRADKTTRSDGTKEKKTEIFSQEVIKRIEELCLRIFTPEYLSEKTKNAVLAKLAPFKDTKEVKVKIKKLEVDLNLIKILLDDRKKRLKELKSKIDNAGNTQTPQTPQKQLKQYALLSSQFNRIEEVYKIKLTHLEFLQEQKTLLVKGKLIWHIGAASNLVVPGSSLLLGPALTALNVANHEKLTTKLPAGENKLAQDEKKNVRQSSLLTLIATTASIFFSVYMLPSLKSTAWQLLNTTKPV